MAAASQTGNGLWNQQIEEIGRLIEKMNLQEDEEDDLVWEEELDVEEIKPKWQAIGVLLTRKSFSQRTLIVDMKVMASDRVKLLYEGHQILNVIFGILFGSLAILRWYTGRVELEGTAILICLAESSALVLVCVLPQFIIRRYFVSRNGTGGIGLEAYVWTGAMVLDDYAALLMINIENVIVIMIPAMILVFIGTLGLEQMKSGTVQVSSRPKDHGVNPLTTQKQDNNEEDILSVQKKNTSDKLELFEFVSYLLQLSSVTWTQYKGQQGSTPGLSDIFCSYVQR
ncbi:hypothetical protein D1007_00178 [Hordeum vulgare]|nr:hypothetical protein D1007_00178 [Hordeum vulgare]